MLVKTVPIQLDRERNLKLTLKGMLEFENLTKKSLWEVTEESFKGLTDDELGKLLWACLIWEDKELKLDDVLFAVNPGELVDIISKLLECLNNAFPKAKGGASEIPLPGKPRTGWRYGPLHVITSMFQRRNSGI